jgi:hypothetical protein
VPCTIPLALYQVWQQDPRELLSLEPLDQEIQNKRFLQEVPEERELAKTKQLDTFDSKPCGDSWTTAKKPLCTSDFNSPDGLTGVERTNAWMEAKYAGEDEEEDDEDKKKDKKVQLSPMYGCTQHDSDAVCLSVCFRASGRRRR